MTTVVVYTYTHSVTYVAQNILKSLKDILVLSGLGPDKLVGQWDVLQRGLATWLQTQDLEKVMLEIFDPKTDKLVLKWDLDIVYGCAASADGTFWTDTDQLRYHIHKAGLLPSQVEYRVLVHTKDGAQKVDGWSSTTARSTQGMVKQSLGSTVHHNGLGASAGYWRHP